MVINKANLSFKKLDNRLNILVFTLKACHENDKKSMYKIIGFEILTAFF
jgi:hypothetical protein